ncbi:MAG: M24 family metallopeptidase [Spirochaetota bacterium]
MEPGVPGSDTPGADTPRSGVPGPARGIDAEIAEKRRRLRAYLDAEGLPGVYLKRQDNVAWITGGHLNHVGLATEMGGAGLLFTPSACYLVANCIEAPRLLQEEELEAQGFEALVYPWDRDREADLIREVVGDGKLAADCPLEGARALGSDFRALRYRLTPAETDRYRELGFRSAEALAGVARTVLPGETEAQVAGRLSDALWAHRIDCAGIFVGADERISRFRHPIVTETPIERRAMITVNARKWGLIVSFTRFVRFGPLEPELRRRYQAAVEIDCAMMAATRPGRPAVEVLRRGLAAYADRGFSEEPKLHHQGGAIGYLPREYKVTPDSTESVGEDQAFAWNPSITGVKSEDTILATTDGPEILTPAVDYPSLNVEGVDFPRSDILIL